MISGPLLAAPCVESLYTAVDILATHSGHHRSHFRPEQDEVSKTEMEEYFETLNYAKLISRFLSGPVI